MATGTVVDVVMPQMGVSVSEGTITRWAKNVGEAIEADETIVEISTDKVDTEIPSPASGIVREILANEGDTVPVNTRIAVIATGDDASVAPADPVPAELGGGGGARRMQTVIDLRCVPPGVSRKHHRSAGMLAQ